MLKNNHRPNPLNTIKTNKSILKLVSNTNQEDGDNFYGNRSDDGQCSTWSGEDSI